MLRFGLLGKTVVVRPHLLCPLRLLSSVAPPPEPPTKVISASNSVFFGKFFVLGK